MSTQPAQPSAKIAASKIWEENAVPRHRIQWCPGCGDFGVLNALKMALTKLELLPHEVFLIGGIGCSGQIRNYLNGNGFHGTHGGPMAYAVGVKMANPNQRVVALAGDGDTFAIGVENFVHACRRDPQVTLIVMDNGVYGLTTGQRSPTAGLGQDITEWSEEFPPPFSSLRLALASGATFVAQSFSGDPRHAADVYVAAMEHPGFAFVNDFSPCVTYNKFNTYEWFKSHVEHVPDSHDPADPRAAWELLADFDRRERLPLGVIYRGPRKRKTFKPVPIHTEELAKIDLEPMLKSFR